MTWFRKKVKMLKFEAGSTTTSLAQRNSNDTSFSKMLLQGGRVGGWRRSNWMLDRCIFRKWWSSRKSEGRKPLSSVKKEMAATWPLLRRITRRCSSWTRWKLIHWVRLLKIVLSSPLVNQENTANLEAIIKMEYQMLRKGNENLWLEWLKTLMLTNIKIKTVKTTKKTPQKQLKTSTELLKKYIKLIIQILVISINNKNN